MMQRRLFDYLNSRQLPTGRRIFVLKAIRRAAEKLGSAAIVDKCNRGLAVAEACLRTEMAYRQGKSVASKGRGQAAEYDRRIDAKWAGIYAIAQGHTAGEGPVARQATKFLAEAFPDGLAALVHLSLEEQLAAMDVLLERFAAGTGDLAAAVDALGVRGLVDQVIALLPPFRQELEKEAALNVTYTDVKNARRDSLDSFAAAIFAVLNTYDADDAQVVEQREGLLAEYHRQNTLVADAYRRHKRLSDVDPATGEPLADDETTTDPVT